MSQPALSILNHCEVSVGEIGLPHSVAPDTDGNLMLVALQYVASAKASHRW